MQIMVSMESGSTRKSNLFDPQSTQPFKLSRSKLEEFMRCPRCFYLDRRWGVSRPPTPPFSLNSAVDHLLKKEFDFHRARNQPHPLMTRYRVPAVPFRHPELDRWREVDFGRGGIHHLHLETNFDVYGAVDDIWQNKNGELIVVDYKATAKDGEVNLDAAWQESYKRQLEIYQWLLIQNSFAVSPTGYFVYVNGRKDAAAFDGKLEFAVKLIPYTGDSNWVGEKLVAARRCLLGPLPPADPSCEYCRYREAAHTAELSHEDRPLTLFDLQ